jgi:hypothetical protein
MQGRTIPDELINHILSFRDKDRIFALFQNSFLYYLRDNTKNTKIPNELKENYLQFYCYDVSFHQWYFCIARKKRHIHIHLLQKE